MPYVVYYFKIITCYCTTQGKRLGKYFSLGSLEQEECYLSGVLLHFGVLGDEADTEAGLVHGRRTLGVGESRRSEERRRLGLRDGHLLRVLGDKRWAVDLAGTTQAGQSLAHTTKI